MNNAMQIESALNLTLPSPVLPFSPNWPGAEKVTMHIKRDDLIHPVISGNKWRKLKYTFRALPPACKHIMSFGGGYSNHLHACAYLCMRNNIAMTAMVRGDYSHNLTPMLHDLKNWGTRVQFVDKKTYQRRTEPGYLAHLHQQYPHTFIVPEGGSHAPALQGVAELLSENPQTFDHVLVPVGSGATLAGLITALKPPQSAIGIAVLKGKGYLEDLVRGLLPREYTDKNWSIAHDYHGGGYGKAPSSLVEFCNLFTTEFEIPIEPVYSGKLMFAVKEMLRTGYFPDNSRLLLLHTGGMQGARPS
ncbi:pyridoxal-phosphate dependent enzyme [Alteromonas sp. C1M14]|uniref:1-aminocyclopropane-1-carboxylate deaminase/D-cysteine desulfhydrase n=1 Tax=Alteromonas sp. C1M14 TaxID=2841567 RepID=UPI001C0859B5|nr:pyridoxal-phosphate dependent enzyme [Alteromonas sp. C1M14]MBU2979470.1 pyridoxal-phosphate dependent enzyme [Alteromonas sp. C1M14]